MRASTTKEQHVKCCNVSHKAKTHLPYGIILVTATQGRCQGAQY